MKCHRRLNELIETLLGNGICIMHSTEPHTVSNANPTSTECVTSPAKPSEQQQHSKEWVSERSRKRKRERAARSNSPPHSLHHFTFDHFDHIADSHSIVLFDLFTFDCNRDMVSSMMPSPKCVYFVQPKKAYHSISFISPYPHTTDEKNMRQRISWSDWPRPGNSILIMFFRPFWDV